MSLLHTWESPVSPSRSVRVHDETLRDGLQSRTVTQPSLDDQIEMLHLMAALPISSVDLGFPASAPGVAEYVDRLLREIAGAGLELSPACAARMVLDDIRVLADLAQATASSLEALLFVSTSRLRWVAEGWTRSQVHDWITQAFSFAASCDLLTTFVLEDASRLSPDDMWPLIQCATDQGASRLCLCDTVGALSPPAAANVVTWARSRLDSAGLGIVEIDWHAHMDRGLAVWTSIEAALAGASRVHGTACGIGERSGNAPLEQLILNLKLAELIDGDCTGLAKYCRFVARAVGFTPNPHQPVIGTSSFSTTSGTHARAILGAFDQEMDEAAELLYAPFVPNQFGQAGSVALGPTSGRASVVLWLRQRGLEASAEAIDRVLECAKASRRSLCDEEVRGIIGGRC